jgi:hypothetical protein
MKSEINTRHITNIEKITNKWHYDEFIETSDRYIELLGIMPQSHEQKLGSMSSPAQMRVRTEWGAAVMGFERWYEQITIKIRDRNLEYEQAEIR